MKRSKTDLAHNKIKKILWTRKFYNRLPNNNERLIRKYFSERSLRYYPELGCKVHVHFKDHLSYLAFPLPEVDKLRGLELREICSLEKELGLTEGKKNRKNYGTKTLWVFKRDTSRMLVAESILDALAGEVILNDYGISLVALNGVGQVSQLDPLVQTVKPQKIILAIDKDIPGRETEVIAKEIVRKNKIDYELLETREKDLLRELHKAKGGSENAAYAT
ncbi:MAG: toprim domain-containing protein [Nitrospirae bacterium]|nr:toprim domain-containing protein [Nitrospirota bacterium]